MALFRKPKAGGFMDQIRCDEPSYLIWKWHPAGSQAGFNNREDAIRWGSSLRVKDGEVAVFVYKQKDGTMQDYIVGPYDQTIKTANFPVLASIVGLAYEGGTPSKPKSILSISHRLFRLDLACRTLMYTTLVLKISVFRLLSEVLLASKSANTGNL